jgi:hypothetical protein
MVERDAAQRPESIVQVKERLREIVERRGVQYGLSAVARISSPVGTASVNVPSTGGATVATMTSKQAQASVYYIPSSSVPPISRRSLLRLSVLSLIGFVCHFITLYTACVAFGSIYTDGLLYAFMPPIFRPSLALLFLFPFLNIIGLLCGHIGLHQANRVFNQQFARPKIQQAAKVAQHINRIGQAIGYLNLVLWLLLLVTVLPYLLIFPN